MSCDRVQDERHIRNVFVGLFIENVRVVMSKAWSRFVESCVMPVLINSLSQELKPSSCHFNHWSHVTYVRWEHNPFISKFHIFLLYHPEKICVKSFQMPWHKVSLFPPSPCQQRVRIDLSVRRISNMIISNKQKLSINYCRLILLIIRIQ